LPCLLASSIVTPLVKAPSKASSFTHTLLCIVDFVLSPAAWQVDTVWYFHTEDSGLFFFGSTGVWTYGLALAGQVLYHLSHTPALLGIFQIECRAFSQGWPWIAILLLQPPM
jgi:hypothetical protein